MTEGDSLKKNEINCPVCGSSRLKILKGIYTEYVIKNFSTGALEKKRIPFYRCLECGKEFEGEAK